MPTKRWWASAIPYLLNTTSKVMEFFGQLRIYTRMVMVGKHRKQIVLVQSLVKIYSCLICHCYNSVSHSSSKSVYFIILNCNTHLRIPSTTYVNTTSSSRRRSRIIIITRDNWIHLDRYKSSGSFVPTVGIINRYVALMANKDDLRQRTMTTWFLQQDGGNPSPATTTVTEEFVLNNLYSLRPPPPPPCFSPCCSHTLLCVF